MSVGTGRNGGGIINTWTAVGEKSWEWLEWKMGKQGVNTCRT